MTVNEQMTIDEKRAWDRARKAAERAKWTPERRQMNAKYLRDWRELNPDYEDTRKDSPERKAWSAEYERRPARKVRRNERQNARRAALPQEEIEALNDYTREWRKRNPGKCSSYARTKQEKIKRNPLAKLVRNLRARVRTVITTYHKTARTLDLVGCSVDQLFGHLEIRFEDGMTWENYGPVWHVDHVRPCASFDLTDPKQQRECFNWRNLQPLFAQENLSKGAKLIA